MKKLVTAAVAAVVPLAGLLIVQSGGATAGRATIPLEDATMIIEVNSTDGDAGLQVFLDGEPWRSVEVRSPDGRKILAVGAKGELRHLGLTELFSESNEPSFDDVPLEEFLALFPEGEYAFSGTTVEGDRLTGTATLSHEIPAGPVIVSPEDGAVVSPDALVVEWEPVTEPAGIDVAGYQVIVEREDPLRAFQVTLPSTETSVTVPSEFLEAATDYKVEVLAIEANGNQTITEHSFATS
jgi:Fibronectin type III domain